MSGEAYAIFENVLKFMNGLVVEKWRGYRDNAADLAARACELSYNTVRRYISGSRLRNKRSTADLRKREGR